MLANAFVDNAKVMAKGQVTIPKEVRKALDVASEDVIFFIIEGSTVHIVNSVVYSMQIFQREMTGEVEWYSLTSDDGVMIFVRELRNLQGLCPQLNFSTWIKNNFALQGQ